VSYDVMQVTSEVSWCREEYNNTTVQVNTELQHQASNRSCKLVHENSVKKYFKLFTTIITRIINYANKYPNMAT